MTTTARRPAPRTRSAPVWPPPGSLLEHREELGRRRRTYSLTEAGRGAVARWVREPETGGFQIRDIASLKLFFGELGATGEDVTALARLQESVHRERLERYRDMETRSAARPERVRRIAPVYLGMHLTEAAMRFWARVADSPLEPLGEERKARRTTADIHRTP